MTVGRYEKTEASSGEARVVAPVEAPSLTCTLGKAEVNRGDTITVYGRLTDQAGAGIGLQTINLSLVNSADNTTIPGYDATETTLDDGTGRYQHTYTIDLPVDTVFYAYACYAGTEGQTCSASSRTARVTEAPPGFLWPFPILSRLMSWREKLLGA